MARITLVAALAVSGLLHGPADTDGGARLRPARSSVVAYTTVVDSGVAARAAAVDYWGGPHTAASGEQVNVFASTSYPQDPALTQRWADFLASLLHGPELATVELYLAPLSELRQYCGRGAAACYSSRDAQIIAPADDLTDGTAATAIVAHEYGHHVAASRNNAPWIAVDTGTKRYATAMNVCARTRTGELSPGDEGESYQQNPGEGFAEGYRVLNERRLGLAESAWEIVSRGLYPSDAALAAIEQDVVAPWTTATTLVRKGTFARRGSRVRTFTVATPLDGRLVVRLSGANAGAYRITVGSTTARSTGATTVCGTRTATIRVRRAAGAGRFTLAISRP